MKQMLLGSLLSSLLFFTACQPAADDGLQQLQQELEELIAGQPGTIAVAFRDVNRPDVQVLINEKEVFHAASTMKTPVMIELYKKAAAGVLAMEDSVLIVNEFYSIVDSSRYSMELGEDSEEKLYGLIGQKATVYDLTYDMIIYSSNLATNILIGLADAKAVTQTMRDMGANDIQVLRGVEDGKAFRQGLNNTTTAYDLMLLFEQLGKRTAVNPEADEAMIRILLDQKFNDAIPALLPKEVKVAHKTGWITRVRHDSGLVVLPDGRQYALVILTKDWESDEATTQVMAQISKAVYDYFSK
ncbi:MAG: class A beta-lactamase-related serine hydrolase [Saprospiraceae bacterium]|jgi:beta-lactamase class A|nr:class A beta-lactamase-related serine hydrolase [Saprospiraceae bacterium]MDP4998813.1 class A beta-lactamase-related serine hydrolase [Saprospiraceae bacterium]